MMQMKKSICLLFALLAFSGGASAGTYEDDLKVYAKNKDYAQAFKLVKATAEQGHVGAQSDLGVMYADGRGVAKNESEAVIWFRRAAEKDHAGAQYNLGMMYEKGRGVVRDPDEAVVWYQKAAALGVVPAQYSLGVALYANGEFDPQAYLDAAMWFRRAAEAGHPGAQFNLGVMYEEGQGVAKDLVRSHVWFNLAGVGGVGPAKAAREEVAGKLTTAQLTTAQVLAKECSSRKFKDC
jgi:TPR repeat protein